MGTGELNPIAVSLPLFQPIFHISKIKALLQYKETGVDIYIKVLIHTEYRINAIVKSMEAAQKGWFALYDRYADGKLEREFFLNEKKKYDADMERMEAELAALKQTQEAEESAQDGSKRKAEQVMLFLEEDELTEDMKEKLIEKVCLDSLSLSR